MSNENSDCRTIPNIQPDLKTKQFTASNKTLLQKIKAKQKQVIEDYGEKEQEDEEKEDEKLYKLAELSILKYEAIRESKAKALDLQPQRLDKLVEDARKFLKKRAEEAPKRNGVAKMLGQYYEIKHTRDYWDTETASRVSLAAMRKSNPICFNIYDKHPDRKSIKTSDIVFKPEGNLTRDQVNSFTGLNVTPDDRIPVNILELLYVLCNKDDDLYGYVLKWLALPLQKLGTKMDTALVFTSRQGTGKSLFFDKCYGAIYKGWYQKIKQTELESNFNGWEAQKLFIFADEIEAKYGQNDVANHIKTRITSDTILIEKKGQDKYEEQVRANWAFCSNDITPVKIEGGDRRFTSVRCNIKSEKDFFCEVVEEINDNGAGRLYSYLMSYDLGDFTANQPPYETEAKQDQIEIFKPSCEAFIDKWLDGDPDIKIKYGLVKAQILYDAYRTYCENYSHTPVSQTKFGLTIKRDYQALLQKERRTDGQYYTPYFSSDS